MATSSLCAPVFTKEDAEKEEKSLSKEERRKIDEDAYGSFSDNDESIDTNDVDIAKENFERALERIVDKGEYQEAVRGCPEVVAAESRPVFFLRSTDFNAESAAEALVQYWRLRTQIFGSKAVLPLRQLVTREDLSTLNSCFLMRLRPDHRNRPVFYYEPSRMYQLPDRSNRTVRCVFLYLALVAAEDEQQQRNGFVVIHNQMRERPEHFDRRTCRRIKEILNCMPMKLRFTHAIVSRQQQSGLWMSTIHPIFLFLLGKELRLRYKLHVISKEEDAHKALEDYGLRWENLPQAIGGSLSTNPFNSWVQALRDEMEDSS